MLRFNLVKLFVFWKIRLGWEPFSKKALKNFKVRDFNFIQARFVNLDASPTRINNSRSLVLYYLFFDVVFTLRAGRERTRYGSRKKIKKSGLRVLQPPIRQDLSLPWPQTFHLLSAFWAEGLWFAQGEGPFWKRAILGKIDNCEVLKCRRPDTTKYDLLESKVGFTGWIPNMYENKHSVWISQELINSDNFIF